MGILIETVAVTGSTNADLIERARSGAPEGLWLRAERQDAGRGRLGRQWQSPAGNLYTSTIVRLNPLDPPVYGLAFVAALAVQATLSPFFPSDGLRNDDPYLANPLMPVRPEQRSSLSRARVDGLGAPMSRLRPSTTPGPALDTNGDGESIQSNPALMLKWPNDVLVDGQKICGMLLERSGDAVVVGIGINVAAAPELPDRTVTCLADHIAGQGATAALLIEDLARHFAAQLANWRTFGMAATLIRWRQHAHRPGEAITVTQSHGGTVSGRYAGLTDDGALRLQSDDGSISLVHAGDVELVR